MPLVRDRLRLRELAGSTFASGLCSLMFVDGCSKPLAEVLALATYSSISVSDCFP